VTTWERGFTSGCNKTGPAEPVREGCPNDFRCRHFNKKSPAGVTATAGGSVDCLCGNDIWGHGFIAGDNSADGCGTPTTPGLSAGLAIQSFFCIRTDTTKAWLGGVARLEEPAVESNANGLLLAGSAAVAAAAAAGL